MSTSLNIPNSTAISLLEVFSPEKIIKTLQEKEDCTEDLVEIIKTTQTLQLKKLVHIFLKVDNFDIEKIVELTVARTRTWRFNSVYLVFSLIKSSYLDSKKLDQIEILFQNVFISRCRDIDPNIRTMCVQFLSEWICASNALRSPEYLKYIGWALNDRSDSVRKKAVRSVARICKQCKTKGKSGQTPTDKFIEKYRMRLIEIALQDSNPNVQKECCKAVLSIFLRNENIFSHDEILSVMSNDETYNELKHLSLKKICPESIWDLDALHTALRKSKPYVFKNLKLSEMDVSSLILNICEFIRNRSVCCDSGHICFLEILKVLEFSTDPIVFMELLEVVKDSKPNTQLAVAALCSVSSYSQFPGSTFKILEYLKKLAQNNGFFIDEFVNLLKKVEDVYILQVEAVVTELKKKYPLPLIKAFDISDSISQASNPLLKCYASLWKILQEDYEWIQKLEFETGTLGKVVDSERQLEKQLEGQLEKQLEKQLEGQLEGQLESHLNDTGVSHETSVPTVENFLELVDFLIFFNSKMPANLGGFTIPTDPLSCTKVLFDKLSTFISKHFQFDSPESCLRLFKLISLGYFTHSAKALFEHCSEEMLLSFADEIKEVKPLVLGYFEFLEDQKLKIHPAVAKRLAGKISRSEKDRYFFGPIRRLVTRKDLLDTVLISFLPCFNVNECIVLENLAIKSKFKTLLLRKCKNSKENEENVTFI